MYGHVLCVPRVFVSTCQILGNRVTRLITISGPNLSRPSVKDRLGAPVSSKRSGNTSRSPDSGYKKSRDLLEPEEKRIKLSYSDRSKEKGKSKRKRVVETGRRLLYSHTLLMTNQKCLNFESLTFIFTFECCWICYFIYLFNIM